MSLNDGYMTNQCMIRQALPMARVACAEPWRFEPDKAFAAFGAYVIQTQLKSLTS
jgi:hypothetical protein